MKTPLVFKIHNPNPLNTTAERILPILLKSNTEKFEAALSSRNELV